MELEKNVSWTDGEYFNITCQAECITFPGDNIHLSFWKGACGQCLEKDRLLNE